MASWIDVSRTPATEHEGLLGCLDAQRIGLIRKVEDLADAPARRAPTVSSLSLLGLLKHSTAWEERWFEVVVAGRSASDGWPEAVPDDDADLEVGAEDTVGHWLAAYRRQLAISNEIVRAADLDAPCARQDIVACNVRYVVLHMIEETARHSGHADILRETLDGSRGI